MHFDWGEYVLWHLSPQIKVSIDGRRETVYSDPIYAENLRFTSGLGDWDAILKRHPTDRAGEQSLSDLQLDEAHARLDVGI